MTEQPTQRTWPQPLERVRGPFPADKVRGAALGMGDHAPASHSLLEDGWLSPDLMTGLTLHLLARQPRKPTAAASPSKGAQGVAGRIWVREQVTYHRPLPADDPFTVEGASTGRHIRKGRRYATTESTTRDSAGNLASTNRTTGLLGYRVDETLTDSAEGQSLEDMAPIEADWDAAARNPHLSALSEATAGEQLGGEPMTITLGMMAARDTDNPENPIHSDPEVARAAGLDKPIAGGSHVQAFALDVVMQRFGSGVLLHGARVDSRWRIPTECDVQIVPRAEVVGVHSDRVEIDFEVGLTGGIVAMVGHVTIPRPS